MRPADTPGNGTTVFISSRELYNKDIDTVSWHSGRQKVSHLTLGLNILFIYYIRYVILVKLYILIKPYFLS